MHHHDHHSQVDPAFELVDSDCHQCGEHSAPHFNIECGHEHRIFGVNITYKPGDFIYWDSTLKLYVPAVEDKCDLMVLRVDRYGTWFEAANIGEFQLKNFTLKGAVYIDYVGELTNTETNTKIGFIENGHLYLSIQPTSNGGGGTPYTLPIATTSVLGGVKVGTTLEIDGAGVLDINDGAFIKNQKATAQEGNAWIDGGYYSGGDILMQGEISNVFGSIGVRETIVSESKITAEEVELQDKGMNSVFGSHAITIAKSIMSSIFGSYGIVLGAPNNTTNSERQSVVNSFSSGIYNADSSIIVNSDNSNIGFNAPNIYNSTRIGIFNSQSTSIIAGYSISVHDSYSINITPVDGSISNYYVHVMASNGLTLRGLDKVIIGAVSGNTIQNSKWTSVLAGYSLVAFNLESSAIIASSSSRINENGTGTFISSALIGAQNIDIEADSYVGWSLVFGQLTKFTNSKWTYSLIGGRAHVLANTLGTSSYNDSNLVVGVGHNLEAINFSLVSGFQNKVRGSQESIIGGYICDIENSSHNLIMGENSTYKNIQNSILAGASCNFTTTSTSQGNLVVGDHLTIVNSDHSVVFGSSNTLTNCDYSIISGYNNQMKSVDYSLISGYGNSINGSMNYSCMGGSENSSNIDTLVVDSTLHGYRLAVEGVISKSIIVGGAFSIGNVQYSAIFGYEHDTISGTGSIVAGESHISTGSYDAVFGFGHDSKGSHNLVFGRGNTIDAQSLYSLLGGDASSIINSSYSFVAGNSTATGSQYSMLLGAGVTATATKHSVILGSEQATILSQDQSLYGASILASYQVGITNVFSGSIIGSDRISVGSAGTEVTVPSYGGGTYTYFDIPYGYNLSAIASSYGTVAKGSRSAIFATQYATLVNGYTSVIMASQNITAPSMSNSLIVASQYAGFSANGVYSSIISAYSLTATSATITDSILKITGSTTLNYNVQKSFIFGNSLTSTAIISESFIFGNSHSLGDSGYVAIFGGSHQIGDSSYYSAVFGSNNKILSGSGYSFVSGSDNRIESNSYYSAILGGTSNIINISSYYSAITAGNQNEILSYSYYSNILGGGYNTIDHGSYNSAIVAGMSNILDNSSYYSVIAGGFGNQMNKSYYGFISGQSNKIQQNLSSGNASWYSGILSGTNNTITEGTGCSIIASSSSTITTAYQSSIISGSQNTITGNGSDTLEATVVSGYGNNSGYAYQFIMGKFNDNKADSVLEIGWGTFSTRTNIFRVTNQGVSEQAGLILKHLASNPSTIVNGQMFTKADGLYVQINGILYKVNLTVA